MDALETSRKVLLDQLLEIDQTMEKPREEDIKRVRNCQNCQINGDGPACVMCELDELFQVRHIMPDIDSPLSIGVYNLVTVVFIFCLH